MYYNQSTSTSLHSDSFINQSSLSCMNNWFLLIIDSNGNVILSQFYYYIFITYSSILRNRKCYIRYTNWDLTPTGKWWIFVILVIHFTCWKNSVLLYGKLVFNITQTQELNYAALNFSERKTRGKRKREFEDSVYSQVQCWCWR